MGLKINKINVIFGLIGLSIISLSVLGLSYMTSKGVENKLYKMSFQKLPKGTILEGLAIKFKKEDISCSGLIKFDCNIKNPTLYNPATKLNIFSAESISVGTFSRKGIRLGNKIDLYASVNNLNPDKDLKEWNNLNEYEENIKKDMFPINLSGNFKIEFYSNKESKGSSSLSVESKTIDFSIDANLMTMLHNNIKKLKNEEINNAVPNSNIYSILSDFKISVSNKEFDSILYNIYLNKYITAETEESKKRVNREYIGINKSDRMTKEDLRKALSKKIFLFDKSKEFKDIIENINKLFEKNQRKLEIKGKNKNFHTLSEILKMDDNQSKLGQMKYFDIIVNVGDIK